MMIVLDDLIHAGGQLARQGQARQFVDFSYDSRLTRAGELFLALRTSRADGHDHIAAALEAGATGVVCAQPPRHSGQATIILHEHPTALAQQWAARRLRQVAPTVLAVSGSIGKTTTKHLLSTLLASQAPTFESRQNFNSLLGLPLALAHLQDEQRFAVLEFGAGHFGEIAQLAQLFPPTVAIITNVREVYLKAFGSLAGAAREFAALVAALPPQGWAILNGDDPYVAPMHDASPAHTLTFGRSAACRLWASDISVTPQGTSMRLHWQGAPGVAAPPAEAAALLPLPGEHTVTAALAAVGAVLVCGMSLQAAAAALAQAAPLPGRLRPLAARGGALLLDDTFDAALPSVLAGLHTLRALPARRRIAVLGALPDLDTAGCQQIGTLAAACADLVVCKGDWGQQLVQAARQALPVPAAVVVHTAADALQALPADLGAGDVLLVQGSTQARMERIAAGVLAPDVPPAHVLVRQEPGWSTVRIGAPDRPTWIRIDLAALAANIQRLQAIAGVPLMVVLKADAYGHGALRVARTALSNGAAALAVATLGEARTLREADITAPILVLGYTPPWQAREALLLGVTCTVFDIDAARALAEAAEALQLPARVHVKVDTGMARLGLQPEQVGDFLPALAQLPGLEVKGLYTHFATADSEDERFVRHQLQRFNTLLREITAAGLRPPLVHAANSAALLRLPEARFDMVRPGIACYGLAPAPATPLPADMRPVLSLHTEVAQVKTLPAGTPVSYGGTFVTQRPSRIATIPVGYADGLRRSPPWRSVLIGGQRAPIVGRICMDYAMVDVTGIDEVRRGDAVVLIGQQGQSRITADEVADWLGTINYEVVSTLLPRVPRQVEE